MVVRKGLYALRNLAERRGRRVKQLSSQVGRLRLALAKARDDLRAAKLEIVEQHRLLAHGAGDDLPDFALDWPAYWRAHPEQLSGIGAPS